MQRREMTAMTQNKSETQESVKQCGNQKDILKSEEKMSQNPMLDNTSDGEKVEKSINLQAIAEYLEQIARQQDAEQAVPHPTFAAKKLPPISIMDYLKRLQKFTDCSNANFVLALIYIERLQESMGEILLNSYTILRLILASTIIAIKYNYDQTLKNDYYAKIGGVKKEELNELEAAFCEMIDFRLYVSDETFENYVNQFSF
ncbi:hypothetical protein ABPG74_004033 [Tetrahymena malaccensis]